MSEAARDLLLEVGTEELPPRALHRLATALRDAVAEGLAQARLAHRDLRLFATPRRLAVLVEALAPRQPDEQVERRGPALSAAFDDEGCPTRAAQGFARSCGVAVEDLDRLETDKGAWLVYRALRKGRTTPELVPEILARALEDLPVPRRMRWGELDEPFVRPVHWIVALYGDQVVPLTLFGIAAGRKTRGHRFHHPGPIVLPEPAAYEVLLETEGRVLADFERRRTAVKELAEAAAREAGGHAVVDPELLDEVTAMVEWPVPVVGAFDERFLEVPPEVLIVTMKTHQKYFHVVDDRRRLLARFVTMSNIASREPDRVREGNERVVRPRLADAEFFWNQDRKRTLASRLPELEQVVFQHKLGSMLDKTRRITALARDLAAVTGADPGLAQRAAELCKCDLRTEMVGEFPELQGTMGRYYAVHDGEPEEVACAIEEHYRPRFAGDGLPETPAGRAVALADRLDTLAGIFAAGLAPTGDKDPYALRRAALGVVRIVLEAGLDLDLRRWLETAAALQPEAVDAGARVDEVADFVRERLRGHLHEQGVRPDTFGAVAAVAPHRPLDLQRRALAVESFRRLPEAEALAAANKRITNILKKAGAAPPDRVDPARLEEDAERALHERLAALRGTVQEKVAAADYLGALEALAGLRGPVDAFFDRVMVMAEDPALRANRLALLAALRELFLQVADISRLQI